MLINHAVFRLGLQKEMQVNARVTNAVERAGEKYPILFFCSLLFTQFVDAANFIRIFVTMFFLPDFLPDNK